MALDSIRLTVGFKEPKMNNRGGIVILSFNFNSNFFFQRHCVIIQSKKFHKLRLNHPYLCGTVQYFYRKKEIFQELLSLLSN